MLMKRSIPQPATRKTPIGGTERMLDCIVFVGLVGESMVRKMVVGRNEDGV